MANSYTREQVNSHIASLRALLAEIGPEVSRGLTALVLSHPTATKHEALKYLAAHLVKGHPAEDSPKEVLIKAYAAASETQQPADAPADTSAAAVPEPAAAAPELLVVAEESQQVVEALLTSRAVEGLEQAREPSLQSQGAEDVLPAGAAAAEVAEDVVLAASPAAASTEEVALTSRDSPVPATAAVMDKEEAGTETGQEEEAVGAHEEATAPSEPAEEQAAEVEKQPAEVEEQAALPTTAVSESASQEPATAQPAEEVAEEPAAEAEEQRPAAPEAELTAGDSLEKAVDYEQEAVTVVVLAQQEEGQEDQPAAVAEPAQPAEHPEPAVELAPMGEPAAEDQAAEDVAALPADEQAADSACASPAWDSLASPLAAAELVEQASAAAVAEAGEQPQAWEQRAEAGQAQEVADAPPLPADGSEGEEATAPAFEAVAEMATAVEGLEAAADEAAEMDAAGEGEAVEPAGQEA